MYYLAITANCLAAVAILLAVGAYGRVLRLLPDPEDDDWKRRIDGSGSWIRVKMVTTGEFGAEEVTRDHQCVKPLLGVRDMEHFAAGSIWRCNCGNAHTITRWVTGGSSQDFVPEWTV